jgi:NodT family efflux transporter outer membrane factor (OMF) lipoprotein
MGDEAVATINSGGARPLGFYLSFALAGLALAGCVPLEALRQPSSSTSVAIVIPDAWARAGTVASGQSDLARWWRVFGDAELELLIDEAMQSAPDVRLALARLRQARAHRDLTQAELYPSLGVSAAANRSSTGSASGGAGQARTLYALGFDARWEPSIFGGPRDAVVGADADFAAAGASLDATRVSLAAEVALDYVDLRAAQRRLAIARENVAAQAETLQLAEWRAEAGLATSLEVEQARANVESTRATLPGLASAAVEAAHRLAVLTGQLPDAPTLRARLDASPSLLPQPSFAPTVGIPADTLRQRPDVRAAELSLRAEIARSAERRADAWPSLSLSGSLGWQAFSTAALGGSGSAVRSLGTSLATTLFDGGRLRSRIVAQDALQEQALVTYEKSILTALADVETALARYATGNERVGARRKAATAAGNAVRLAQSQYAAGLIDFQRLLDVERTRLSAEDGLVSAETERLTALIQLYKALGGGWRTAPLPAENGKQNG